MSEQPVQLDTLVVRVREIPLRKVPGGPDRMFVQTDGTGNVLVDFADGVKAWGKTLELNEAEYEAVRQEAFRRELADLDDFPTYIELYPSPRNSSVDTGTSPNGNTQGRVIGETPATGRTADEANAKVVSETSAEGVTGDEILDGVQLGLDIVGLIPVFGEIADIANAGISLTRGDYAGAALSLVSAIPFAGYVGTAGKVGRHAAKATAEASAKTAREGTERAAKEVSVKVAEKGAESTGAKVLGNAKVSSRDAPPLKKGISPELYRKLRAKTPSKEIQTMVNNDVVLPMKDPALPGLDITKPLHADHIVPMKQITEMKGFDKLTFEQQVQVLNHKPNFHGLSETANTSRGAKTYSEWTHYKKGEIHVDPAFRNSMIERANKLELELQKKISSFL